MAKVLKFDKIPELDWLKTHVEELVQMETEFSVPNLVERMEALYKYLLWSRRYQLLHPQYKRDEYDVAHSMLMLNHRIMMGMDIPDHEQALIDKAQTMLKESNEEIRRRKAAKGAKE
jgi:hypothetical protein